MFYFCKMQGTGNDFVIINYIKEKFEYSFKLLAEFLCDRHYGVGADGLIIIEKSEIADIKMRIFNPDGEEAQMCGNGIRCFAKYIYENNIIKKEKLKIETKSGIKNVELFIEGKTVINVKVDMGKPIFEFEKIPVIYDRKTNKENEEKFAGNEIYIDGTKFYPISFGNPHTVCFAENLDNLDIEKVGKKVENHKYFPNKTNVEFVQIINENKIRVKIWERGVGKTLSCGTGSCAAAVISHIKKSTNCDLIVDLDGGILKVKYDKENDKVYLEGDAKKVFDGYLNI